MRFIPPIILVLIALVAIAGCFSTPEEKERDKAAETAANNLEILISEINKTTEKDMLSNEEAVLPRNLPVILRGYLLDNWTGGKDYTWIDPQKNDYVYYDLALIQNSPSILVIQQKSEENYVGKYYTADARATPVDVYEEKLTLAVYELPSRKYLGKKEINANIPDNFRISVGFVGKGHYTYPASPAVCDWIKSRNN